MPQVQANGLTVEYDVTGAPDAEPLLLIMGLGAQMTRWAQPFVNTLAGKGFRVIRFDNRDVGLTTKLDAAGIPAMADVFAALKEGRKPDVPYTLSDMAADAVGVLDGLGIQKAHIVGASLGGMVAQLVAADYPERTLSLTSIMSTSGHREVPGAAPEAAAVLNNRGPNPHEDLEGFIAHSIKGARVVGSPAWPADEAALRERAISDFKRSYYPPGFARQYAAAVASPERRPKLAKIKAPSLVIHGADDPLVPLAGGQDTAKHIPGAELKVIAGMGHDIPEALNEEVAEAIAGVARRAKAAA